MARQQQNERKEKPMLTGEEAIKFGLEDFAKAGPEIDAHVKKRERIAQEARFRFPNPSNTKG